MHKYIKTGDFEISLPYIQTKPVISIISEKSIRMTLLFSVLVCMFILDYNDEIRSVTVYCSSSVNSKFGWLPSGWTNNRRETNDRKHSVPYRDGIHTGKTGT